MNGLMKSRANARGLGITFMTESMRREYHSAVHRRLAYRQYESPESQCGQ